MIIRKTLREQVVEILRHKILSGEIKPGERIIEAKVAEELKVSRGPLREALRQIEEEGLVVYEAQKGCVVKTMTYEEMQETYRKKSVYMPLMKIHWKSKLSTRHLTSWNWFPHQLIR